MEASITALEPFPGCLSERGSGDFQARFAHGRRAQSEADEGEFFLQLRSVKVRRIFGNGNDDAL